MLGKKLFRFVIGLVIAASLLAVMFSYQVRNYEKAVVETLGTMSAVPIGPGLKFRWPWPIQKVTKYDCRTQHFEGAFAEQTTIDNQSILLGLYVCWKIEEPGKYHRTVSGNLNMGENIIRGVVRSAQNSIVGSTPIEAFASTVPGVVKVDNIEKSIKDTISQRMLDEYGIEIQRVGIKRISLPEQVTEVVMENERKKRMRQAQEARSKGQAAAEAITSEAQAVARQVLSFAGERAAEIRAKGQEGAAKYYSLYGQDQGFAMFLRRLEYLKETMKNNTLFVLDGNQYDLSHGWFRKSPNADSIDSGSEN